MQHIAHDPLLFKLGVSLPTASAPLHSDRGAFCTKVELYVDDLIIKFSEY